MPYIIGVDEAGYGPNLGPLVISATLWRTEQEPTKVDLYDQLSEVISSSKVSLDDDSKIAIADSKLLYKPGGSLASLERGVLTGLSVTGSKPKSWRDVWHSLDSQTAQRFDEIPWYSDYDCPAPQAADAKLIDQLASGLQQTLQKNHLQLLAIESTAIFPGEFNDLVDHYDGKGAALSNCSLKLIRRLLDSIEDEPVLIQCDKHGGRNRYGALLQNAFGENWIEVCRESRPESVYRWGSVECRKEIRFTAKGERYLPAALASMASKYLRELAMQCFNQFWTAKVAGLKPTAGYPLDAKRFRADIAQTQRRLKIDDHVLWRNR